MQRLDVPTPGPEPCQWPQAVGGPYTPPTKARICAAGSLAVIAGTAALVSIYTVHHIWYLLAAVAAVSLCTSAIWVVFTNRRWRGWALVGAVALLVGAIAALWAAGDGILVIALVMGGMAVAGSLGSIALRHEVRRAVAEVWRRVPAATHPVLLMNPKAGGGKVDRYDLMGRCGERGIEAVVLRPGENLRRLAEMAVAGGADVIGMAGGDGSQAVVASVAAAHDLGYVCIPAGTRNHLALDLGVDRDDVVGALDAFGAARERPVDLATVNGQVFVNNVSLGLYADIVASEGYRDQKVKTAAQTLHEDLGPDPSPYDLHLDGPGGRIDGSQIIEVSNNPYVVTSFSGLGTRPRMDTGKLGVITVRVDGPAELNRLLLLETSGHADRFSGLGSWTATTITVDSASTVAAGIDGEASRLQPPVRFASLPAALRVRVALGQPGVSPAVRRAPLTASAVAGLWKLACGRPSGLVAR